jgi:hypothetical protein
MMQPTTAFMAFRQMQTFLQLACLKAPTRILQSRCTQTPTETSVPWLHTIQESISFFLRLCGCLRRQRRCWLGSRPPRW